jgi:hypothetical protein
MATFQGAPLTFEAADAIKKGWLAPPDISRGTGSGAKPAASSVISPEQQKGWSWLVAGGKNAAFDFFPCQHQLYYSKGSAFW